MPKLSEPLEILTMKLLTAKTELASSEMWATVNDKKLARDAKKEIPKRRRRVKVFEDAIRKLKAK